MKSKTCDFFYEISKIPRESGNEKEISDYICNFAQNRNLEFYRDKYNNVIIKKKKGINEPIILQAHLDMVCEKELNKEFNFAKDSIELYEEDGYIKAKGTTLGADNGIGVAQILNILDSDLKVNIEAVFTVSEETTMIGAENIDLSILEGRKMINLDGFESNTIVIESAKFIDIVLESSYKFEKCSCENLYEIELTGLEGGHSGFDIDKNRGNSIKELAEFLIKFDDIHLCKFIGGTKFNVIPSNAKAIFYSNKDISIPKDEKLNCKRLNSNQYLSLDEENSKKFLKSIIEFKNGVHNKTTDNFVTTSVNLGVVNLEENTFKLGVRSSRKEEEKSILEYLKAFANNYNYKFVLQSFQPGFETPKNSFLVYNLKKAYMNTINKNLQIKPLHITVEAGFFYEKIPSLEVAIISPEIIGAHTINERVNIKSIEECDRWLNECIKLLCFKG